MHTFVGDQLLPGSSLVIVRSREKKWLLRILDDLMGHCLVVPIGQHVAAHKVTDNPSGNNHSLEWMLQLDQSLMVTHPTSVRSSEPADTLEGGQHQEKHQGQVVSFVGVTTKLLPHQ